MNSRWCRMLLCGLALFLATASPLCRGVMAQQRDPAPAEFNGVVAIQNDDLFDAAAKGWKKFIAKYPTHRLVPLAKYNQGLCYIQLKQYAEAIAALQDVQREKQFKQSEAVHLNLGYAQLTLGKAGKKELVKQAAATFKTQIAKWPKGKGASADQGHYFRGDALYFLDDKDGALTEFLNVVQKFPSSSKLPDALYSAGFILQQQEKWQAAGDVYSKFLKDPKLAKHSLRTEVSLHFGETLLERRQFNEAEQWLKAAAQTDGFMLADWATFRLADSYAGRQKHAEAAAAYLSIPEKFAKLGNVDANVARLEGGKNYYLAGENEKAQSALSPLIPLGGDIGAEAAHWSAQSLLRAKKPANALKVVDAAAVKAKGTVWEANLMMDRADALYAIPERRNQSNAAYAKVAADFPQHRLAPQALYNAAYGAMNAKEFAAALKYCGEFHRKYNPNPLVVDVQFVEAESHTLLKQYDEAGTLFQKLLKIAPEHVDADLWKVRLGQCAAWQNKHDAAIKALKPFLTSIKDPTLRAEAYFLTGDSQFELGRHDDAIKAFQAALTASETWEKADDALVKLARAHRKLKDHKSAVVHLKKAIEKFPDSDVLVDAHYELAECTSALGDYKTAAAEFQWVVTNSKNADFIAYALQGLGKTYVSQSQYAAAEKAFSRLIQEHSTHSLVPGAYLARAQAYRDLKQFDKATGDFLKYLSLEPTAENKSGVLYELGRCQTAQKKFDAAVKTFTAILKEDADYAGADNVLFALAWALNDQNKPEAAAKAFEKLYSRVPDSRLGLQGLHQLGEIRFNAKDYTSASRHFYDVNAKVLKLFKADKISAKQSASLREAALHKYGWCHFHLGNFADAGVIFGLQLKEFPIGEFPADAQFMLGESLFKQEKNAEGLKIYLAYLKDRPDGRFSERATLQAAKAHNRVGREADKKKPKSGQQHYKDASALIDGFLELYRQSEQLPEAMFEQAQSKFLLGQMEEAEKAYQAVIDQGKREVAARSRFMIGEIYYRKKEYTEALKNFYITAKSYGYPTWQANALYEAGRCLEQLKKPTKAKQRYQEIVDDFPKSDKAPLAKQRLKQLGN